MKIFTNSNDPKTELGVWERSAMGFGNLGNSFVFAALSSFLVFYYTDVIGLNAAVIGTLMLISRLFDGISDLVMGHIVDRTKSKFGKARCYMLWISIPFAIASVFLFSVPQGTTAMFQYIYVFVSYNVVCTVLYTALAVPYQTLSCLITESQYERGLLGIFSMIFATIGVIGVNSTTLKLVGKLGGDASAWTKTIMIYAAIGLISHLICFFSVKERIIEQGAIDGKSENKVSFMESVKALISSSYWVKFVLTVLVLYVSQTLYMASLVYYCRVSLNNVGLHPVLANYRSLSMMFAYFIAFILFKRLGKVKTMYRANILFILVSICELITVTVSGNVMLISVWTIIKGVCLGLIFSPIGGIGADCVSLCVMKTGIDAKGVGVSAMSFGQKAGSGIGSALLGFILARGAYSAEVTEFTSQTITAINFAYLIGPIICAVIVAVLLFKYSLDEEYPKVMEEYEKKAENK